MEGEGGREGEGRKGEGGGQLRSILNCFKDSHSKEVLVQFS